MPKFVLILIIVLSSLLVISLLGYIVFAVFISRMMAVKMCQPKHFKSREEKRQEIDFCHIEDEIKRYKREAIEFVMPDGYVIHGDYSLNDPKKFVICMHGHISMRDSSLKYAGAFYRLGYSLVFYDHRSHGDNKRGIVTMGYQEHLDLIEITKQVRKKFGQDIELGLFGCSMGAVTALLTVNKIKDISFIVSDCAFASLEDIVRGFIKQHHSLVCVHLPLTNLFLKKKYHLCYNDVCPKESLKEKHDTPILFIHGTKDDFVYPNNAELLYSNNNGPKELVMFEGAVHCGSVESDREKYYKVIEEFIKKYTKEK